MILAIDVKYNEIDNTAKSVGVLFDWLHDKPTKTIEVGVENIEEYIPGHFYKRELPCIKKVINQIDLASIEAIIVDGHIYVNNQKDFGLGGYVYEEYEAEIPVIGVAKTSFFGNEETVIKVFRGKSKQPLYISSIGGISKEVSAQKIKSMQGEYRIPTILKELDMLTKKNKD